MSMKRRTHRNSKTFAVQTVANAERVKRGALLDGQDERVQRVMKHLWGSFDAHSVIDLITREFKLASDYDPIAWDVAQRLTEMHCGCEGYTDACVAELLEHVVSRTPLPMDQRVLWDLERYHYKNKEKKLEFYFVLQPYQQSMSLLWFVDEEGTRVSTPKGVTHHTEMGHATPDTGGCFPVCWLSHSELRYKGKCIAVLEPQCPRVLSSGVTTC